MLKTASTLLDRSRLRMVVQPRPTAGLRGPSLVSAPAAGGRVVLTAAVLTCCLVACGPPAPPNPDGAPTELVVRVIDGDTIETDGAAGSTIVRVLGIDSPETHRPGTPIQCWGAEATTFARDTLLGQHVTLVDDPTQDRVDRYGRRLAYVHLPDGSSFSMLAAAAGAARAYTFDVPVREAPTIQAAQDQARATNTGLWGPPCLGATGDS